MLPNPTHVFYKKTRSPLGHACVLKKCFKAETKFGTAVLLCPCTGGGAELFTQVHTCHPGMAG